MREKNKSQNLLLLGLLLASAAQAKTPVVVIDGGADLNDDRLRANKIIVKHKGDDGKTIDISGWNVVSNSPNFMPSHILDLFEEYKQSVNELFGFYTILNDETSDAEAKSKAMASLRQHEFAQYLPNFLQWSHGSHVSGIIHDVSKKESVLGNFNIFDKDRAEPAPSSLEAAIMGNGGALTGYKTMLETLRRKIRTKTSAVIALNNETLDVTTNLVPKSPFDSYDNFKAEIDEIRESSLTEGKLVAGKLKAFAPQVVNMSFGAGFLNIAVGLESMWKDYLVKNKLPLSTKRNEAQEKIFAQVLNDIYRAIQGGWAYVFQNCPEIFFTIAAGNSGDEEKGMGNHEKHPETPADLSPYYKNVITVAATNKDGSRADFSSYGVKTVNVGDWGVGVPSMAPRGMVVGMSGTSMAAPRVAGLATSIRSINPKLKPEDVRKILEGTGTTSETLVGRTTTGKVTNHEAALRAAMISKTKSVDDAIKDSLNKPMMKNRLPMGLLGFGLINPDQDVILPESMTHTHPFVRVVMQRLNR